MKKKKITLVRKPRTRSLFNTGTRPHKSKKDYTRKAKHKQNISEDGDLIRILIFLSKVCSFGQQY